MTQTQGFDNTLANGDIIMEEGGKRAFLNASCLLAQTSKSHHGNSGCLSSSLSPRTFLEPLLQYCQPLASAAAAGVEPCDDPRPSGWSLAASRSFSSPADVSHRLLRSKAHLHSLLGFQLETFQREPRRFRLGTADAVAQQRRSHNVGQDSAIVSR